MAALPTASAIPARVRRATMAAPRPRGAIQPTATLSEAIDEAGTGDRARKYP